MRIRQQIWSFVLLLGVLGTAPAALCPAAPPVSISGDTAPSDIQADAESRQRDEQYRDAEKAASQRVVSNLVERTQACADSLSSLAKEYAELDRRFATLPESEEGKRLAATLDEASAREVMNYLDAPVVDPAKLTGSVVQAKQLLENLKAQREQLVPGYIPPTALLEELSGLENAYRSGSIAVRQRRAWLDTQLVGGPTDTDQLATLKTVLDRYRWEQFRAEQEAKRAGYDAAKAEVGDALTASAREAERQRLLEQARETLAKATAELDARRADFEAALEAERVAHESRLAEQHRKRVTETNATLKKEAETGAIEERGRLQAEKIRLQQRCQDPVVRDVLAPFLAPGTWQGTKCPASIDEVPFSYRALVQNGALEPTEKGLSELLRLATSKRDGSRPRWPYKTNVSQLRKSDPRALARVRESQKLLIELGPTLVELKMLSE